jgi:ubiquinone/menaquinone biosynthesis C-methylase UbiE
LLEGVPFSGTILDAGCGEALFAEFLERRQGVTRIVNVDLGDPTVVLHRRKDPRHEAVRASLLELPFEKDTFDGVLCAEVLEQIEDDASAARELARVTKPGGTLLVSVPMPTSPPDPAHERPGYTLDQLQSLLTPAGFEVVRHEEAFFSLLKFLYTSWQWHYRVLGKSRRSYMPSALVRSLARADVALRFGPAWNLAAVARRR